MGAPGIGIVALPRTSPTSTRSPPADLNSMTKVSFPWRNASCGDRRTTSYMPDLTRCSSVNLSALRQAAQAVTISSTAQTAWPRRGRVIRSRVRASSISLLRRPFLGRNQQDSRAGGHAFDHAAGGDLDGLPEQKRMSVTVL